MVTKQKPLAKGGFYLFIVWFEIESNFENHLNLRGLKMKYISTPVYKYSELSEQAQFNARIEWEDTEDPTYYFRNDVKEFITELKDTGIVIHSWSIDYCDFDYEFTINCDLSEHEVEGLSAFKKILALYYQLNSVPKIYESKTQQRISKIQQIPNGNFSWMYWSFIESLKEVIQQKKVESDLIEYVKKILNRTFEKLQQNFRAELDSLPVVAEEYEYYFFANGSRCYDAEEV